jgi:L-malate glycosyltransferase
MKILYTVNSGNPGGMEQHVLDLIKGMRSQGHEVFVWCNAGPIVDWYKGAGAQVEIKTIGFDIDPIYIYKLTQFLRQNQIDVIHAHELKAGVNSLIAGRLAQTDTRITHTHTPLSEWQINPLIKKINVLIYTFFVNRFASYEVALTESRKDVKIAEGIKNEKLVVIPNAVDVQKFNTDNDTKTQYKNEILGKYDIPQGRYIFGNVSRLTIEKNHETLIRAFAKFLDLLPNNQPKNNFHLLIAGGGNLHEALTTLTRKLQIQSNVTITGRFSEQDHTKIYSTLDAFIFPSLAEGFGIVLIEAMAAKLPIICSDLDVLREVGSDGIFAYVTPRNAAELAEQMHNLYEQKDKLHDLISSSVARVENVYTLDRFTQNYLNLYSKSGKAL